MAIKTEPTRQKISGFIVSGITVRTITREEMNHATAKLGIHWGRFHAENIMNKTPHRSDDPAIYGVYSEYESDIHGHYNVTAGVAVSAPSQEADLTSITIDAGDYLVFSNKGLMPQAVIETWQTIWQYFQANPQIERKYTTDFERYQGIDEVSIYIAVK